MRKKTLFGRRLTAMLVSMIMLISSLGMSVIGVNAEDTVKPTYPEDLLVYESFSLEGDPVKAALADDDVASGTESFGWSGGWEVKEGFDYEYDNGIFAGDELRYEQEGNYLKTTDSFFMNGVASYAYRAFDLSESDIAFDATYYPNSGNKRNPATTKAIGKEGTTAYFSGLMYTPVGTQTSGARYFALDLGVNRTTVYKNYLNNHLVMEVPKGSADNTIPIKLSYVYSPETGTSIDSTTYVATTDYVITNKEQATFFVFKFDFANLSDADTTNDNTTISLYLDPDISATSVPTQADAVLTIPGSAVQPAFDRVFMANTDGMAAYTAYDEFKLGKTFASVVDVTTTKPADYVTPNAKEVNKGELLVEEDFDYVVGQKVSLPTTAETLDGTMSGGIGWQDYGALKKAGVIDWETTYTYPVNSMWAMHSNGYAAQQGLEVMDAEKLPYGDMIVSDTYLGRNSVSKNSSTARLIDVSAASRAGQLGIAQTSRFNPGLSADSKSSNTPGYYSGIGGAGTVSWIAMMVRFDASGAMDSTWHLTTQISGNSIWNSNVSNSAIGFRFGVKKATGEDRNLFLQVEPMTQKVDDVTFTRGGDTVFTGINPQDGQNHLVVIKMENNTALNTTLSMYVDPDLYKGPGEADATVNVSGFPVAFKQFNVSSASVSIDAFRVGTTFDSVTPIKSYYKPADSVKLYAEKAEDIQGGSVMGGFEGAEGSFDKIATVPADATLNSDGYYEMELPGDVTYKYIKFAKEGLAETVVADFYNDNRRLIASTQAGSSEIKGEGYVGLKLSETVLDSANPPSSNLNGTLVCPQYNEVELSTTTENADIYYTLDGSDPVVDGENTIKYESPIAIEPGDKLEIKAIAVKEGLASSVVSNISITDPSPAFESGYVVNGDFETINMDGSTYGWTFWSASVENAIGLSGTKGLKIGASSGGAVVAEAGKIDVSEAGTTVRISANVKMTKAPTDNSKYLMIKVHAKGDNDANFEPAKEMGKMLLVNGETNGLNADEFYMVEMEVPLPVAADYEGFANPYFRVELWNDTDGEFVIDDLYVMPKTQTPTITPESSINGEKPIDIEIKSEEGAKIYYTTDGSEPTVEEGKLYEDIIKLSYGDAIDLKAVAKKDGKLISDVATGSYSIKKKTATPEFSYASGDESIMFQTKLSLEVTVADDADIYYTIDGSEPTKESDKYSGVILLGAGQYTVKAIAYKDGEVASDVAEVNLNITELREGKTPSPTPFRAPGPAETPGAKETIKILSIGNSYSQNAHVFYPNIVEECADVELVSGHAFIGGSDFEKHWDAISNNSASYTYVKTGARSVSKQKLLPILQEEEWDYVVIQQVSGKSGVVDSMRPYVANIVKYIRDNCPSAELAYHQTWAYSQSLTGHADFNNNYDGDADKMYEAIVSAVNEICAETGIKYIVPSGTAVKFMREAMPIADDYALDKRHLNVKGQYLVGLTWFEFFTGIDARTTSFKANDVADDMAAQMKRCAHAAVSGGYYDQPWEDPDVVYKDVPRYEMQTTGEAVYKYDYETGTDLIIENQWGQGGFGDTPTIVSDVAYAGSKSLYLKGNYNTAITNTKSFIVDADTDYILKFKYKGNITNIHLYMNDTNSTFRSINMSNAPDWTEYTCHFKTYKNIIDGAFGFKVRVGESAEVWIDDIELYKAETVGEALEPTPKPTQRPKPTPPPVDDSGYFDYKQDFETDGSAYDIKAAFTGGTYNGTWGIEAGGGVDGSNAFYVQSTGWGNAVTNWLAQDLDPNKTYRVSLKAYGDICMLKLAGAEDAVFHSFVDLTAKPAIGKLPAEWTEFSTEITGQDAVKLFIKVQASSGINNGKLLIDDVRIVDVEKLAEEETPTPDVGDGTEATQTPELGDGTEATPTPDLNGGSEATPIVTVEPTSAASATPTATPSESPTVSPEPTSKVKKVKKVKFVKKKIKVKVGKKATLKVKLTPAKGLSKKAKKVKWSIDKKGKKVVKFVKKAKKLRGKLKVKIKALKKGKAKVTCKAPSGKKAICKITVK